MANPTVPFSWQMPEPTDLVTNLPADFEVFGQAVATDLQYLLGGTTGQVLAKASGTDLDFDWVTDAAGMTNPMTTTSDMIYSSSGSTPGRIGIGSDGDVLTVTAGVPGWAAASSGAVIQVVNSTTSTPAANSTSTYADTGLTASITPTSASNKILVIVTQNGCSKTVNNSASAVAMRLVRDSTTIAQIATEAGITGSALFLMIGSMGITYLDSPATTSSTTYKTQFMNPANAAQANVQGDTSLSAITLIEVTP
jgi:hypothetical protein